MYWFNKAFSAYGRETAKGDPMSGNSEKKTNRTAQLGLLLAVAVMLGYVEAIVPISAGIPGVKAGLANCAVLFVLYRYGAKEAAAISLLRTVIIAGLFTNVSMLLYSLAGAMCSIAVMKIAKKGPFSVYGVSMAGGVTHNLAQVIVAFCVLGGIQTGNWWFTVYLPVLMVCGMLAGAVNAMIAGTILERVKTY